MHGRILICSHPSQTVRDGAHRTAVNGAPHGRQSFGEWLGGASLLRSRVCRALGGEPKRCCCAPWVSRIGREWVMAQRQAAAAFRPASSWCPPRSAITLFCPLAHTPSPQTEVVYLTTSRIQLRSRVLGRLDTCAACISAVESDAASVDVITQSAKLNVVQQLPSSFWVWLQVTLGCAGWSARGSPIWGVTTRTPGLRPLTLGERCESRFWCFANP
ncbi:hypothetical protein C8Q80DRAFT_604861 [Daedaleopsis nitida]|nr:hypothetical protein C8Q80DRAFT_604861 [Daedaleopsis nitida]